MKQKRPVSLVVHGGAWNVPEDEVKAHRAGVLAAVGAGWEVLKKGGSAVDAVQQAVMVMENDPAFNAGRGAELNAAGEVELDAAIMEGGALRAGAVAALRNVANPVALARAIMEEGETLLLVGIGATLFARERGIPTCAPDALITGRAVERWRESQREAARVPRRRARALSTGDTVGAVALDSLGTIAAASSTGGVSNKRQGRVGDSPLIGCGIYADNALGGVSATGWGEGLIRVVMAKSIVERMAANDQDPEAASGDGIALLRKRTGGKGGAIALNAAGRVGIAFNTPHMPRAYMTSGLRSPVAAV